MWGNWVEDREKTGLAESVDDGMEMWGRGVNGYARVKGVR